MRVISFIYCANPYLSLLSLVMEKLNSIYDWFVQHPTLFHLLKYLIWVLAILFLFGWIRRYLRNSLPDIGTKYKAQKGVEILGYIILIFVTVFYFSGRVGDFGMAIGLLTAGITITLQELILSIAGSFYIYFVKVYKPGDRIQINGIKGDVIDIDSVYTTMMEIGEWVHSDNYSGRIVKLTNSFVFKGPVYNYSQDFPFVWDEFDLPIRYGSDLELAKAIVIEVAQDLLASYVKESLNEWESVVRKYYIENAEVNPSLAIKLTDNWVQLNLRYIVDYKKRRSTMHRLNEEISKRIAATDGKVVLASATMEIVRIPMLDVESHPSV